MSISAPELRTVPPFAPTVRDRWPLVAGLLVLGLALGYLLAAISPTPYTATATVRIGNGLVAVGETQNDNGLTGSNEAKVAVLPSQLRSVAAALGGGASWRDVGKKLEVVNPPDTQLLNFDYTADSAAEAEEGADTAAQVYLDTAKDIADQRVAQQVERMRGVIVAAPPKERAPLQAQLQSLSTTVVDPGLLATSARGNAEQAGIPIGLYVPLGAVSGLLAGLVIAYLLEARKPKVRPGTPIRVGQTPHLGRIRVDDTPATASHAFVLPGSRVPGETDRIAFAVLGGQPEELLVFASRALAIAERMPEADHPLVDLDSAEGLQEARSSTGVFLLVRERRTTLSQVEETVDRLTRLGIPVVGIVTAPAPVPENSRPVDRSGSSAGSVDPVTFDDPDLTPPATARGAGAMPDRR